MARTRLSWVPALLLMSATVTQAVLDLHNTHIRTEVSGRRIDNLVSGLDWQRRDTGALNVPAAEQASALDNGNIAARLAQNGLDANALLNGLAQGQGQGQRSGNGDINTNDVGGDLANQIAGGGSTSVDDILIGLNGQKQSPSTNQTNNPQPQGQSGAQGTPQGADQGAAGDIKSSDIAEDLANQLAPKPGSSQSGSADIAGDLANQLAPNGQGQLPSQSGVPQNGSNFQTIQIVQTIVTQPNGQEIAATLVEAPPQGAAETTPPAGEAPAAASPSAPAEATAASSPAVGEATAISSSTAAKAPAEASASSPAEAEAPTTSSSAKGEAPAEAVPAEAAPASSPAKEEASASSSAAEEASATSSKAAAEAPEAATASASSAAAEKPAEAPASSKAVKTVFPAGKSALPKVTPIPWTNAPSQMGGMAAGNSSSMGAKGAAMPAAEPMQTASLAESKNSTQPPWHLQLL
ncbi:uncharacterized protein J4E92_008736 [Alternaria infectoria]|uniref:uncharacterized protein n=1 Tax=Alternaria infectoria TaxID=45303 RepID=UPI00222104D3|nr:uncharacterized protein J4E92_008736 [Alternaria infectoria]KAI4919092.1 hypothetical protein J4E92_008736 [Alternaria infectoria]